MKRILLLITTAALLASCNDFLDTVPDNRIDMDSEEKAAMLIASAYPKGNYAATLNPRVDLVSDKGVGFSEHNANTDAFFWRDPSDTSQDTPEYIWARYYESIAACNAALRMLDGKTPSSRMYISEAKLIRAFSHFLLVNLFAKMYDPMDEQANKANPGVPYVTEPEETVVKQYDRITVDSVYKLIERDLVDGLANVGAEGSYKVPRYHFTASSARAFAARFYLYKGEWGKVIEHANAVIEVPTVLLPSGNVSSLDAASIQALNNFHPWLTTYAALPSSTDVKLAYCSSDASANLLLTEMPSRLSRYTNLWRYATKKADTDAGIRASNATGGVFCFKVMSSGDNYYVPKFYESRKKTDPNASTFTVYSTFPYLRYEEILLNRAEAFAQLGNVDAALNDLNVFCRQRVWTSTSNMTYNEDNFVLTRAKLIKFYNFFLNNNASFLNKYNAFDNKDWAEDKRATILFILDTRRAEFMWEGLRYWDMVRYKIPSAHATASGATNTLYPGDDRWVLQMPSTVTMAGVTPNPRTNLLSPQW